MPQKAMNQHRDQPMMMPAWVRADCIGVHPQCRVRCFATWLDRPAHPAAPDTQRSPTAERGMTAVIPGRRLVPQAPLHHEPDGPIRHAIPTERDPTFGPCRGDGAFGPFRARPSRPAPGRETVGNRRDRGRQAVLGGNLSRGTPFASRARRCGLPHRPRTPGARVRRHRHHRDAMAMAVEPLKALGAVAIEALRDHRLAWHHPLVVACREQLCRSLGCGVQRHVQWDLALRASRRRGIRQPRRGQDRPLVEQRVATGGGRGRKAPDATVCHLAQGTPILSRNASGVLSLCGNARLIDDHDALGGAQVVMDHMVGGPAHLLVTPDHMTDEALHGPDSAPATARAVGAMDVRSRSLHGPTIERKKCSRGSGRVKQSAHTSWKA
jgi:hypothetical protein